MVKAGHFDKRETWQRIQQLIPNATVRDTVQEIFAATLPYDEIRKYAPLLKELEATQQELGIETIDMANATLEEVFLKYVKRSLL